MDAPVSRLSQGFFSNKPFLYAVGGSLVGQMLVIYWPPMQRVFQTEALSFGDLGFILALTSSMLVLDTIRKAIRSGQRSGRKRSLLPTPNKANLPFSGKSV